MNYLDEVMKRSNVQALREFLLYGGSQEPYQMDSYQKRLDRAYDQYREIAMQYDDREEDSPLFAAMNDIITEYEHVYMELGMQAGFKLAEELLGGRIENR